MKVRGSWILSVVADRIEHMNDDGDGEVDGGDVDGATELPGPDLARALLNLAPAALDFDALVAAVGGWEQLISWAQAQQNDLLAELHRNPYRVTGTASDIEQEQRR